MPKSFLEELPGFVEDGGCVGDVASGRNGRIEVEMIMIIDCMNRYAAHAKY